MRVYLTSKQKSWVNQQAEHLCTSYSNVVQKAVQQSMERESKIGGGSELARFAFVMLE
ncbi:MAG TPA: hypothetical protein V6D22_04575 [Candidatus Obscuribacterales bacterium]